MLINATLITKNLLQLDFINKTGDYVVMAGEMPEKQTPMQDFQREKSRLLIAAFLSPDSTISPHDDNGRPNRPVAEYALIGENAVRIVGGSLKLTEEGMARAQREIAKTDSLN